MPRRYIVIIIVSIFLISGLAYIVGSNAFNSESVVENDGIPPYEYDTDLSEPDGIDTAQNIDQLTATIIRSAGSDAVPRPEILAQQAATMFALYGAGSIDDLCDSLRDMGFDKSAESYSVGGQSRSRAEAGFDTVRGLLIDTASIRTRRLRVENNELVTQSKPFSSMYSTVFNPRLLEHISNTQQAYEFTVYEILVNAKMNAMPNVGKDKLTPFDGVLGITYFYAPDTKTWIPIANCVYDFPTGYSVIGPPL